MPVLTPLPNVTVHVVQPPRVGLFLADSVGIFLPYERGILLVPRVLSHLRSIITKAISRRRSGTARKSKPHHWVAYTVVHQNWKLVANTRLDYWELYDIVADPYETRDLKKDQPQTASDLIQRIKQWKQTLPARPTGNVFSAQRLGIKP